MKDRPEIKQRFYKNISLTSLGWEIAIPIFGGVFIGYQIDKAIETQYIFTLSLLLLGVISGYFSLYRMIELEMLRTKSEHMQSNTENGGS